MRILSIVILILSSCCEMDFDKIEVFKDSVDLTTKNGIMYYRENRFTGYVYDKYHDETQKSSIPFNNGLRHGAVSYTHLTLPTICIV